MTGIVKQKHSNYSFQKHALILSSNEFSKGLIDHQTSEYDSTFGIPKKKQANPNNQYDYKMNNFMLQRPKSSGTHYHLKKRSVF
jgi:hypothetical protein